MSSYQEIFKKNNQLLSYAALITILGYTTYLIIGMIKPGHDWGGDFALYINQCVHLSNGSIHDLYASNKFAMKNSLYEIGPYLYPQGFPILLLPVYWIFGINLFAMKIFCTLFFLASLFLLYKLMRPHFEYSIIPLITIAMLGVSPHYIEMTDNILSEFPFIFFVLLSIYLLQKERTLRNQILLGVVLTFTYLIRDIGIILIAIWGIDYLVKIKKAKEFSFYSLIPIVVFAALFIITKLIFPSGGANHQQMLFEGLSWDRIVENYKYYVELLSNIFLLEGIQEHVGNKMLIASGIGALLTIKKNYHFLIFVVLYFVVLLMWPSQESFRFLLPILGLLLFFMGILIEKLAIKLEIHPTVMTITVLLFTYCYFMKNTKTTTEMQGCRYNQAYTTETKEIYTYLRKNISEDEIIGFVKPRVLSLFTGHKSIMMDVNSFDTSVAQYLLVPKNLEDQNRKEEFTFIKDFKNYYLLSKK